MASKSRRFRSALLTSFVVGLLFAVSAPLAYAAPADLDPTLAGNGILRQRFTATNWGDANTVVVQPDGKILIGGAAYGDGGSDQDQLVARFNPDGSLDQTFGTGGYVLTDYATLDDDLVTDMALLPDGKIVTVGSANWDSSDDDSTVTRYLPSGLLDDSFSGDGKLRFDADVSGSEVDNAYFVSVSPAGKITIAGTVFRSPDDDVYVKRLNADGNPDVTFNGGNTFFQNLNGSVSDSDDGAAGLVVHADGSVRVAARFQTSASTTNAALIGIDDSGNLDSTFGPSGSGIQLFGTGSSDARPVDLAELPDGRLALLFNDYSAATATVGLKLWFKEGTAFDGGFGTTGVAKVSDAAGSLEASSFVALSDGSFLIGGRSDNASSNDDSFFAKVTAGGTPDMSFGTGGLSVIDSGASTESFSDVAIQPDGKFLGAGGVYDPVTLPNKSAQILRVLGNYVAPPLAPIIPAVVLKASIKSPSKSKLKASKLKSISGSAVGTGLAKVQLAIQQIDSAQLKKKKCLFVKNSKGSTKSYKAVKKKCSPTKYLTAKGTADWKYSLKLKPGKYKLFVRAVDASGKAGLSATKTLTLTK
jgi:uncharacterized delta-60 repeat protein